MSSHTHWDSSKETVSEWLVSTSEEEFSSENYSSKEEAIQCAPEELNLESGDGFYVGKRERYLLPMPCAQSFFEERIERDWDRLGDWAEHWEQSFHKQTELKTLVDKKLEEIQELISEMYEPTFHLVSNVTEHVYQEK